MIAVVNYGLGNVQAILNIYHRLGIPATAVGTADSLRSAERIILPGVGAFDWAVSKLKESGMTDMLSELVIERRVPVLGICVGMQILADSSEEGAYLGWAGSPGRVKKLPNEFSGKSVPLPHMGWNTIEPKADSALLSHFHEQPQFYFLHSYYFSPVKEEHALSVTEYGTRFASAVQRQHVCGVQFHPEKSHGWGVQLLKNFAGWSAHA